MSLSTHCSALCFYVRCLCGIQMAGCGWLQFDTEAFCKLKLKLDLEKANENPIVCRYVIVHGCILLLNRVPTILTEHHLCRYTNTRCRFNLKGHRYVVLAGGEEDTAHVINLFPTDSDKEEATITPGKISSSYVVCHTCRHIHDCSVWSLLVCCVHSLRQTVHTFSHNLSRLHCTECKMGSESSLRVCIR